MMRLRVAKKILQRHGFDVRGRMNVRRYLEAVDRKAAWQVRDLERRSATRRAAENR